MLPPARSHWLGCWRKAMTSCWAISSSAFHLANSGYSPIPGTKKIEYLHENLGALTVKLSDAEIKEIRVIAEKAESIEGDRYPPGLLETLYVDTPLPEFAEYGLESHD